MSTWVADPASIEMVMLFGVFPTTASAIAASFCSVSPCGGSISRAPAPPGCGSALRSTFALGVIGKAGRCSKCEGIM